MIKLVLLLFFAAVAAAILTWALARHMELAEQHRLCAARSPRARPYGAQLPASLRQRQG